MKNKLLIGTVVVFLGMSIISFLIHGVILTPTYKADPVKSLMRPESEMMGMIWIYYLVYLIVSFFFTLVFSKGYDAKGIAEGVRYGFYIGVMMATPMAYASYAMYPMPYSLAFQWFIYTLIQYLILGVVVAAVYGKKQTETPAAS
jgi:hypothetical protein